MKYQNQSEENLVVPTATSPDGVLVAPREEILTSPLHAARFIEQGTLKLIETKTRSRSKQAPQEASE